MTNTPREVAETALAHAIGDKTEAAYRRGDLFEKRRRLMKRWAAFVMRNVQDAVHEPSEFDNWRTGRLQPLAERLRPRLCT
jgi:hypothetical protein